MRRPPCEPLAACTSKSHEPCVAVCAANDLVKVGGFAILHNHGYTTRANIAHEKAEQIRARIVRTPAEKRLRGRESNMCVDGMESALFIFSIGCIWTLSCRGRRYPVSATPTHTLRVCVNSHRRPARHHLSFSSSVSSAANFASLISQSGRRQGPTSKPSLFIAALTGMGFGSEKSAPMSGRYFR